MSTSRRLARPRGMTLIELIVFIVIVSTALVGMLSVLNITVMHSADPMIRKNMLAIAESLLEEVAMHPFTYCDPSDRSIATATSASLDGTAADPLQCWDYVEVLGTETGEIRGDATNPFNNVSDYYAVAPPNISTGLDGNSLPADYSAKIELFSEALNGINDPPPASPATGDVLRIAVTVTHGSESLVVEGYRARYAPNSP